MVLVAMASDDKALAAEGTSRDEKAKASATIQALKDQVPSFALQ